MKSMLCLGRADGATFVMLRPDRCVVAKELYWGHGRRPRVEDAFAIELFASRAKHVDVVLDIGAYTGIFTLVAAAVNGDLRLQAFEIAPEVHRLLSENCEQNRIADRTTLHLAGVGADGATMRVPEASHDSALPSFYSARLHFDDGVDVPFRSLDSLTSGLDPSARVLMKIDVEGTENEILRHGQAFLSTFHPDMLCEVLPGIGKAEEVEKLLAPHGYRFYRVRAGDLAPSEHVRPSAPYRDWFFTTAAPSELDPVPIAR